MTPAVTKKHDGIVTDISEVPVTGERTPYLQEEDTTLTQPGTARANVAASVENPDGTESRNWTKKHQHQTVLQQHCAFFDQDEDGIIWPLDTYRGFAALNFGIILSVLSMLIIHGNFSYPTVSGILPDPFFRIYTSNIHKDKHGSDSGTYDNEGRFLPQKFEDIFAKYASGDKKGITVPEIRRYLSGQRVIIDPIGWGGALFEWLATYIFLRVNGRLDEGRMMKNDIRMIYDGSIFYEIAANQKKN